MSAVSPGLSATGVSVSFGGIKALADVSISVPPASVVGLVGPNGAGKTTLFGALSGLLKPQQGAVFLDGVDVSRESAQQRSLRGLARTFQHPQLFAGLTVREHLVLGHRARHERGRIFSDALLFGSLRRASAAETRSVDELLELLGLSAMAHRSVVGLPLGVSRLVDVGRALAFDPSILLLDEPSAGLDARETDELEATLMTLSRERALSLLLVEHNVDLVMRVSSRIFVLDFGRLIAEGPPELIRADSTVRAAYLGEELPHAKETAG
jgi:ABC-type branched-subunit amino acid transport system ATPase component